MARQAGVHIATASRALNDDTRRLVAEPTVERVLAAARDLDYRPNHLARSLKTQRSATVGVVLPDITNPLFPPIVRGIEDCLGRHGYVALVANTDNDDEREQRVLREMHGRYVDGLIVATARRHHPALVEVARSKLPIVLVNRVLDDHRLPSVSVDDHSGVRAALAHLIGLGHRRIAHVAGPQGLSTGHRRYLGFLEGMASGGLRADSSLVVCARAFSEEEGYRCAEELFGHRRRFTAVLAGNDMLALGVLRALRDRQVDCPAECSLVGFNDMPFMDRVAPPLTTVHLPHYDIGYQAAGLLLERIREPAGPIKVIMLPPELIVRESTALPGRARPKENDGSRGAKGRATSVAR